MDLVRLAIVYDTTQAAASLQRLDSQLVSVQSRQQQVVAVSTISDRSFRQAGRGALILAQSMATGQISAVGMAGALGHVAEILLGPWGIALAIAVAAVTLLANRLTKTREDSQRFADQLREVRRRVDQLLNPETESPFGREVEHLTDLIDALDRKIQETNTSWLTLLRGGLGTALMSMGFPQLGAALLPGVPPEQAQANRLRTQRARLTPEAEVAAEVTRYNNAMDEQARILLALNRGQLPAFDDNIRLLQEHLENLAKIGEPAADEIARTAAALNLMERRLEQVQRNLRLMERGLFTLADAIEDFVMRGTFAFSQFLNNILRLLYRSATEGLVESILHSATRSLAPGTVTTGEPTTTPIGSRGPQPQLVTNVHFNVQAMDAQSVATFFEQNGPRIAGIVANQAGASRAIRRRFLRG